MKENRLVESLDFKEYRSIKDAVSISELNVFEKLPSIYKYQILDGHKEEATKPQMLGTALHAAFLEPAEYFKWYKSGEKLDKRTSIGKAEAALRAESEAQGYVYLSPNEMDLVNSSVRAMHQNTAIKNLTNDLTVETSMFWIDPLTGVKCKGRMDAFSKNGKFILDVKTTKDAKNFLSSVLEYGYHRQAAYYLDGLAACTNDETWLDYYWVVVEMDPPFTNCVYKASVNMLMAGRIEYENALMRYAECKKKNEWPGLENQVITLSLPNWYLNKVSEVKT